MYLLDSFFKFLAIPENVSFPADLKWKVEHNLISLSELQHVQSAVDNMLSGYMNKVESNYENENIEPEISGSGSYDYVITYSDDVDADVELEDEMSKDETTELVTISDGNREPTEVPELVGDDKMS